ncbi:MAG: VanW family protein [Clostridia bacterium]|nr:VanW family protein [Clostridia bacterium]
MIERILKFNRAIILLAVTAGIIFCFCAFTVTVPKGVEINGIDVGGLTRQEASLLVRKSIEEELKGKQLKIVAKDRVYTFSFPEIYYKDNVYTLIKNAKKGDKLTAGISYYLCGLNSIAPHICLNESTSVIEPYAEFFKISTPFSYREGRDGEVADEKKLIEDVKNSLSGGFEPVKLHYTSVKRQKTLQNVKEETKLLATFTTYFDDSNINRTSNIRLASNMLNGTVLESGKTLSFNDIVGARVKERGFLPAKIIENGEFTEGVGGGVCQVSTTLYNTALLCGLEIEEYHPHSLAVGYVPPSRDAMVSGTACDLKIKNPFAMPVYVRAKTVNGSVTFSIYGLGDGAEYSISSNSTGTLPAPEEVTSDPEKARAGKDGLLSESYVTVKRGSYTKTYLLRKDKYKPVKKVVYEGAEAPPEPEAEESENNG